MSTKRLLCRHLVTGDQVLENALLTIDGASITAVEAAGPTGVFDGADPVAADPAGAAGPADPAGPGPQIEVIEGWVLPGFVDSHTHGAAGHDVASTDPDDVRQVAAFSRRHGATSIFASLVTAGPDTLQAQLQTLAPLAAAGEIAGIHLEGPFLSPAKRGAHTPGLLREPDPASVDRLIEAADGQLSMVTLAPELPGATAAISRFTDAGVTVAIGHTDGDDRTTLAALDAGATVATHLFNAMRPIHHREPGPVPVLLTDPRATVELICDGVHLHPEVVRMAIETAGPRRVALITDAMVATGMPDGGYLLGGLDVTVTDGVARLNTTDGSLGSIAGSTLRMRDAVTFCVQRLGLPIADVAVMAATTPALTHGLDRVGAIAAGKRADLVVVDDRAELHRVMAAGQWQEPQPIPGGPEHDPAHPSGRNPA